jgi:hypothetical protein
MASFATQPYGRCCRLLQCHLQGHTLSPTNKRVSPALRVSLSTHQHKWTWLNSEPCSTVAALYNAPCTPYCPQAELQYTFSMQKPTGHHMCAVAAQQREPGCNRHLFIHLAKQANQAQGSKPNTMHNGRGLTAFPPACAVLCCAMQCIAPSTAVPKARPECMTLLPK